jgi:hypothetical protein
MTQVMVLDSEMNYFLNRMERSRLGVEARWDGSKPTGHDDGPQKQGR